MRLNVASVLKKKDDFETEDIIIRTENRARTIPATKERKCTSENKWTTRMADIRNTCCKWTDEEIRLYECIALNNWESR